MNKYEILPHTADLSVRASGDSKEELVRSVLRGMFEAAEPDFGEGAAPERRFSVVSADFETLLVDLLNEAIAFSCMYHEAYDDVRFSVFSDTEAEGVFIGRPVTRFGTELKAATFHDLQVAQNDQGLWETTVTFDV